MQIWKKVLEFEAVQIIDLPKRAKWLACQVQQGDICLWFICDETCLEKEKYKIYICGTGTPLPEEVNINNYVTTVQLRDGNFIFHIFNDLLDE